MNAFWSSTRSWRFVRLTVALFIGLLVIAGRVFGTSDAIHQPAEAAVVTGGYVRG